MSTVDTKQVHDHWIDAEQRRHDRSTFLTDLIGKPWAANASGPEVFDCWHLARHVEAALFGRDVPTVSVPAKPSWDWMIRTIETHPERHNWHLVSEDAMGLIRAKDGALVLMARYDRPAHIGVWLAPERCVIHADARFGVVCEPPIELKTKGWTKLRFFEPI